MKHLILGSLFLLTTSVFGQKILFETTELSIKKLSSPEKIGKKQMIWVWDTTTASTLLIGEPEFDTNLVFTIYDLEQDENGIYYLNAEESFIPGSYYEIIMDRTKKTIILNSISPIKGITLKFFNR